MENKTEEKKRITIFGLSINLSARVNLQIKLTIVFVLLLSGISLLNFFGSYTQVISTLNEGLGHEVLSIARTASLSLAGEEIKDLIAKYQEKNTFPPWSNVKEKKLVARKVIDQLKVIKATNHLDSVYLIIKEKDRGYIIAEASNYIQLGSSIPLKENLLSAFEGKSSYLKRLITTDQGLSKTAYAPIYDAQGKVVAVVGIDASKKNIQEQISIIQRQAVIFLLLSVGLSLLTSILVAQAITSPIQQLLSGILRVTKGDLSYQVKIKNLLGLPFRDEIGEMAVAFNRMIRALSEKNEENRILYEEINRFNRELSEKIKQATCELEEINKQLREKEAQRDQELKLAQHIQSTLLPRHYKTKGVVIESNFIPATELGGDFYSFIPIDPRHLAVIIGDVVGRGVPAALLMSMVIGILHETSKNTLSPKEIFQKANDTIRSQMSEEFPDFASAFLGILNLSERTFTYAKAGQELPILYRHNIKECELLDTEGTFLGVFEDVQFEEKMIKMELGDKIVLYTDGVTEAQDVSGNRLGRDELINIVTQNGDLSAKELLNRINSTITTFTKGTPQNDDLAIVVMEITE